jgi:hypothetical protein
MQPHGCNNFREALKVPISKRLPKEPAFYSFFLKLSSSMVFHRQKQASKGD